MKLKVINTAEEFRGYDLKWKELYYNSKARNPFLSYDWLLTSLELFGSEVEAFYLIIEVDDKILAALPLIVENKKNGLLKRKVLRHANNLRADFSDALCLSGVDKKSVLKILFKEIDNIEFDIMHVDNISSVSNMMNLYMKKLTDDGYFYGKYVNVVNPVLNYVDVIKFDKKQTREINKRFAELSVEYLVEVVVGGEVELEYFDALREFHSKSFPNVGFNTDESQSFYKQMLSRNDFDSSGIEFSYILVNGQCAACHFGFKDGELGEVYYYVPAYDNKYKKYSIGKILLLKMMFEYEGRGYKCFNFLRGAESYKTVWATNEYQNISVFGCKEKAGILNKAVVLCWLLAKSVQGLYKARD